MSSARDTPKADRAQFVAFPPLRAAGRRDPGSPAGGSPPRVHVTGDLAEAVALSDRIGILRDGIVQQVGTVEQLRRRPANLFVAGLIGSPPMNLMNGRLAGESLSLPFGDVRVPQAFRATLRARPALRDVIAAVRPEDVADVRLADDATGLRFSAVIAAVEPVGSASYGWLRAEPAACSRPAPCDARSLIARLDPAGDFRAGRRVDVVLDPDRLLLFDPSEGWSLTAAACPRPPAPSPPGQGRFGRAPAGPDARLALMGAGLDV
jgi:hypothetical protein